MIVINGRFLSQRITGIQRFAYEICCALHQIGTDFVILSPENIDKGYDLTDLRVEIIGGKGSHYWEQVTLPRYMKRHYNGCVLLSLSGLSPLVYGRNILTIHDISYVLRPRSYSLLYCLYYQFMTPLAAGRAKKILTVSEFSKDELVDKLHVPADKIGVVYNAVRPSVKPPRQSSTPYLLSVASLLPRKNLKRLLEAYCGMENPDFELYLVGGILGNYADAGLNEYVGKKGVHFLGYVSEEKLSQLYRDAIAYINPSLYEGFGIPNVEAMNMECPLVVSDIPAFREVCGDAAIYFNPLNTKDIQDKMSRIVQDDALRKQLIAKGSEQMKQFSWEKSADEIMKIIQ
ncbi:MAG: glycosyltransferase family 4 protein [Paludibacteraceae bacterium]|nr:glycosyltransferase family 4 protein [Paludibacteraceae bacterium]